MQKISFPLLYIIFFFQDVFKFVLSWKNTSMKYEASDALSLHVDS